MNKTILKNLFLNLDLEKQNKIKSFFDSLKQGSVISCDFASKKDTHVVTKIERNGDKLTYTVESVK